MLIGALRIEIVVEGEKQPYVLNVGKAEGNGYLATSDKLPGDVFTVRKDLFEKALTAPAYFAR